jgi:hypothetical protein
MEQVFLVDYQIPTNEFNIETVKRCQDGQIGKISMLNTKYYDNGLVTRLRRIRLPVGLRG